MDVDKKSPSTLVETVNKYQCIDCTQPRSQHCKIFHKQ